MTEKYIPSQKEINLFEKGEEVYLEIEGKRVVFFKGDKGGETYIDISCFEDKMPLHELALMSHYLWQSFPSSPLLSGNEILEKGGKKIMVLEHEVRSRLKTFFNS